MRRDRVLLAADMVAQALELSRKPHVVIATPGRLADHLRSSNTFSLKKLKFLVGPLCSPLFSSFKTFWLRRDGCGGDLVCFRPSLGSG